MAQHNSTLQTEQNRIFGAGLQDVGIIKSIIKKPFVKTEDNGIKMQPQTHHRMAEYFRTQREISQIIIKDQWVEVLDGIEDYSHLVVLYWAHKIPEKNRSLKQVRPMGRKDFSKVGIYCTLSPVRPNPILMAVVQLKGKQGNTLEVTGLDAVDGSPLLDIKPYVKEFYPQQETFIPEWMKTILRKIDELKN